MKNYVISLTRAKERRVHVEKEFRSKGIEFDFFDAVEPSSNKKWLKKFNIDERQVENLNKYEISCMLSHLCLWEKSIDENLDYIGIFEDDIFLGEDASKLLTNYTWLNGEDVVKLEKFHEKVELSVRKKHLKLSNRFVCEILGKNLGTAGYLISKSSCQYMKNYLRNTGKIKPIDVMLFNQILFPKNIKIFQINPALVIQDSVLNKENITFSSCIEHSEKEGKNNLSFDKKIGREVSRVYRSIRMKEITFK